MILFHQAFLFLFFPVQGTFFDDINEASQKEADKHHNGHESIPSQSPEIDRVGIKENHLHVKQNKQNGNQKILDGHGLTGIPELLNTTFKYLELV
jgi:hypothetical protein